MIESKNNPRNSQESLFGHSVTSVIRWMKLNGWIYEEIEFALLQYDIERPKVSICNLQYKKGLVAKITTDQEQILNNLRTIFNNPKAAVAWPGDPRQGKAGTEED